MYHLLESSKVKMKEQEEEDDEMQVEGKLSTEERAK
jgi:hypothetical protein